MGSQKKVYSKLVNRNISPRYHYFAVGRNASGCSVNFVVKRYGSSTTRKYNQPIGITESFWASSTVRDSKEHNVSETGPHWVRR
jgi:hypothetical protein